jgi:hypothetical protein
MRKALYATLAAATVFVLTAPANRAAAAPAAAPANVDTTVEKSSAATPAHHGRHRHYRLSHDDWALRGAYWYPRHYWYAPLNPNARYYVWGPYWGHYCYNPGRPWGWRGYIACYM